MTAYRDIQAAIKARRDSGYHGKLRVRAGPSCTQALRCETADREIPREIDGCQVYCVAEFPGFEIVTQ